jgi:hypothetical protein
VNEEEMNDFMAQLEQHKAVYQEVEPSGEIVYRFNMDILQDVFPEMYEMIMEQLDEELLHLYELGLIDVDYDEQLHAKFSLSKKGKIFIKTGVMPEDDVE